MNWNTHFRAVSGAQPASFGGDPYDDVIGASTLEVTMAPSPPKPSSFDLSRVPAPLFVALTAAGVLLVAATSYSLGQIYERERIERHLVRGEVKISHVRRKPLLGHAKERAWALREALARTPSRPSVLPRSLAATRRDVA
jgi:hypothetical protein